MNIRVSIAKLFDFQSYKRLWFYSKSYRGEVVLLSSLNIVSSLIYILIALLTKQLIDIATSASRSGFVVSLCLMVAIFLIELMLSSFSTYRGTQATERIRNDIQFRVLEGLYDKKWLDINTFKTGDLMTRLYSDVSSIVTIFVTTVPSLIALTIQLIIAFIVLSRFDPLLASLTFLITPIMLILSMLIGKRLKDIQMNIQKSDSIQRSLMNESLQNLLVLKAYQYLKTNLSHIKTLQLNHQNFVMQKNKVAVQANMAMYLGYRFGFFGAIGFGAYRIMTRSITFGTFTAFLQLVGQIQGPLHGLTRSVPQVISSMSSVNRIDELLDLESEEDLSNSTEFDVVNVPHSISFEEVSFEYVANQNVLDKVNLTVTLGHKIAIMGESGEGKTTLLHLMLALLKPTHGKILLNHNSHHSEVLQAKHRCYFSYVPQSNALFSGSIYSNFLLQCQPTEEELKIALEASCCNAFIDELPDGLQTVLGERGNGLSQGQAQRITIARALLHKTPFLMFDEATSALDTTTERLVIERLKKHYPDVTLIAITHRDNILDICDSVYLIKDGQLSQMVGAK